MEGKEWAPSDVGSIWVQPAQGKLSRPVWGHARGLRVGLPPMPGPRGLLRIYAPYLGHSEDRMINYIAVEPIPIGQEERGFSEMEMSDLDHAEGKRLWSADHPMDASPKDEDSPARGIVSVEKGIQTLTVFVFVEPFRNDARVYLRVRFRSDRVYEVGIAMFAQRDSKRLKHCVITATMGNWARLRTLHLREYTKLSTELWPDYSGDGFTRRVCYPLNDMIRTADGHALFIAAPNEEHPHKGKYAPDTHVDWKYCGKVATQYWRCEQPDSRLIGCVNGRSVYWASTSPIPGGVAYENFELIEPFRMGAEYYFGVTPCTPDELRKREKARCS